MQLLKALWALAGAALCCFLVLVIHAQFLKEGQLAAGTCEIVTLDRDSSQPRRTIARQTARCACRKGQIAGTTRARPACVDARIIKTKQWCDMLPCLEGEGCDLLINRSGWTCTQPGGRIKTTTVRGPWLSRVCAGEGACAGLRRHPGSEGTGGSCSPCPRAEKPGPHLPLWG
uniref:TAFA chemokine like family member 5 n=1 Tax=Cercocebus atys TaxID=9531 RepID=A0A2K5M2K7_CERAT